MTEVATILGLTLLWALALAWGIPTIDGTLRYAIKFWRDLWHWIQMKRKGHAQA